MAHEEPALDASADSMVGETMRLDAGDRSDRAVDAGDSRADAARDASDAHPDAARSDRDAAQPDAVSPDDADGGVPGDAATGAPTRWAPAPGALPKTINYVYVESDPGDWVLRGHSYLYTQANSVISLRPYQPQGTVQFDVSGDQSWVGSFQPKADTLPLVAGYYPDSHRYPFYKPGIAWTGEGAACNTINGWLSIDHVTYVADALTEIDLRFEQHCDDDVPGLRGAIHWRSDDPTAPMGPVNPPPPGLWKPAAGTTPVSGNYIYTQWNLDPPEILAAPDVMIQVSTFTNDPVGHIMILDRIGSQSDFVTMVGLTKLEPGYYGDVLEYPFHNPARGGMRWMLGSSCGARAGWFVVDHVTYANNLVRELDLRFESGCIGQSPPLHGQVHYVAP